MIRSFLFLLLLLLLIWGSGSAFNVQVGPQQMPSGAVLLVVDGLGSSYVYPEHRAYTLDGSPLDRAVLYNLTGGGARAVDVRVPVPETTKSHSVLITGSSDADPDRLGQTIFDAARENGILCLAVLERGDSMPVLEEQDAVLYLGDNALHGAEPIPGFRERAPQALRALFQEWRDKFEGYTSEQGPAGYVGYDAWALDAAADIVGHLPDTRFVMLVNIGGVDSAGQNLGAERYIEIVQALDTSLGKLAEACRKNNCILIVTADHGMVFPSAKARGGHSAAKYADRWEALRVPLVFQGTGVEELNIGGHWSEVDIAPTVLSILNISSNFTTEGKILPIRERYDLQIVGAPGGVELWQGNKTLANAAGDKEYNFRGLALGCYTLKSGKRSWDVLVSGDMTMDLAGTGPSVLPGSTKKIVGVIIIMAINIAGLLVIIRIIRREK